ncbi:rCG20735, isoform CRA_b [Rattus norvegicus]|uniref:RCG20735, isoform CRA_b n=1 Tax=Rattus norvegicus TaxID=10116 RepID=A6JDS6_RAT|nr:rCG20735, isoform CRA_b [Rattus norvegicus]
MPTESWTWRARPLWGAASRGSSPWGCSGPWSPNGLSGAWSSATCRRPSWWSWRCWTDTSPTAGGCWRGRCTSVTSWLPGCGGCPCARAGCAPRSSCPQVKGPGIGLLGISKGGELGLAMASFLKGITAAVVINGSVAAVGNTICYKDETIPPVTILRNQVKMTKDGLKDVVDALQSPLVEQKSFIPVERSDTTFLFLVGQDDHNWKSEFYANEISKRLQAHGKEKPQIICYPEAGHYIEPPYFPLCSAGMHLLVGANITFGGEPKPHSVAQLDAWQQLQTFFHKQLGGKSHGVSPKI